MHSLARRVLDGQRLALSRALSRVENETEDAGELLADLFPKAGRAHLVGITGAPGAGKSTLVNALARMLRFADKTVAIVAVDPTSPFTGGAILGDRVRMNDLVTDPGIFIRSVASRGNPGGLAHTTADLATILDAFGFDIILIETVGAGQSEVAVARTAHTTVLVEAPGLGDEIQAVKAGIVEIADIVVLNKSDLPGADEAFRVLHTMLPLPTAGPGTWRVPLLRVTAVTGTGIAKLVTILNQHFTFLQQSGELVRRERTRVASVLERHLRQRLYARLLDALGPTYLNETIDAVVGHTMSLETAVSTLLDAADKQPASPE